MLKKINCSEEIKILYDRVFDVLEYITEIDFKNKIELRDEPFYGFKLNLSPRDIMLVILNLSFLDQDIVRYKIINDEFINVNDLLEIAAYIKSDQWKESTNDIFR